MAAVLQLRPWLLEVNKSPSYSSHCEQDDQMNRELFSTVRFCLGSGADLDGQIGIVSDQACSCKMQRRAGDADGGAFIGAAAAARLCSLE